MKFKILDESTWDDVYGHDYWNTDEIKGEDIIDENIIQTTIFDEENIDKIFTSFKRVDSKKNRNILGTGLGLSITKQLVELMNGRVSVESTLDVGSTFTVTIPKDAKKGITVK